MAASASRHACIASMRQDRAFQLCIKSHVIDPQALPPPKQAHEPRQGAGACCERDAAVRQSARRCLLPSFVLTDWCPAVSRNRGTCCMRAGGRLCRSACCLRSARATCSRAAVAAVAALEVAHPSPQLLPARRGASRSGWTNPDGCVPEDTSLALVWQQPRGGQGKPPRVALWCLSDAFVGLLTVC